MSSYHLFIDTATSCHTNKPSINPDGRKYLRCAGGERLRRNRGDGLLLGRSQSLTPPIVAPRESFAGTDDGSVELMS